MDTATGSLAELVKDTAGKQIITANIIVANNGAILLIYYSYLYYVNYATASFDL
ncbi:hypothetical protein yberc0001_13180 [Yersinia bercovieri ATCC 43970]|uniref:Uncharacterized protein n=1 Tax=Yersinia bercovieri ATCC 43970 TaxID=349968 RepID=A0ABP2E6I8_YERBE|nr:hypothetical protein yberc0001_13180 [Yersinia bercovieri ATCC 43970]